MASFLGIYRLFPKVPFLYYEHYVEGKCLNEHWMHFHFFHDSQKWYFFFNFHFRVCNSKSSNSDTTFYSVWLHYHHILKNILSFSIMNELIISIQVVIEIDVTAFTCWMPRFIYFFFFYILNADSFILVMEELYCDLITHFPWINSHPVFIIIENEKKKEMTERAWTS